MKRRAKWQVKFAATGVKRWGHGEEAQASSADVAAEIGDLLFLVARLADLCGVDLDEAQRMVLTKFKRRLVESGPRR